MKILLLIWIVISVTGGGGRDIRERSESSATTSYSALTNPQANLQAEKLRPTHGRHDPKRLRELLGEARAHDFLFSLEVPAMFTRPASPLSSADPT